MSENMTDAATLQGIAFVGRSLGPFFRYDPVREADAIGGQYAAIAGMDAQQAADAWPFVEAATAFKALCLMQEGLEDDFDEGALTWEYRRLFVGPAKKVAPPWGSVYTDKDGVMFGASWIALNTWLRQNGVSMAKPADGTPEDHIGLLLELMAWLADNRPELVGGFLQQHLLTWAGHFLDLVQAEAQHPFFEGLAQLTRASLDGIQETLGLQVDTPRFFR